MRVLGIETSSAVGSIAMLDGTDVAERFIATAREQTDLVLPLIEDLLAARGLVLADLDAIAFGRGPGAFTGLRIAAAVAQGLAMATQRPLVGVSSMRALAQRAWRERGIERALVCIDARMQEVYWACYDIIGGRAALRGEEQIGPPESLRPPDGVWAAIGSGWQAYREALAPLLARAERAAPDLVASARDLLVPAADELAAGRVLTPEQALPVYLRGAAAWPRRLR